MASYLANLPPSILSLITRLLPFNSALSLSKLSGNALLSSKCTVYGGISEILVDTEASLATLFLAPASLTFFARLTSFVMTISLTLKHKDYAKNWALQLPPTMTEIRIRSVRAFDLLLRHVDTPRDDLLLGSLVAHERLVPVSIRDLYPNLTTLEVWTQSEWRGIPHLTPAVLRYFVRSLPASLTSLTFKWPCESGNLVPNTLLEPLQLPNLRFCDLSLSNDTYSLKDYILCAKNTAVQADSASPQSTDQEASTEAENFNFSVDHLTSLKLPYLHDDASLSLFKHFTSLTDLQFLLTITPNSLPLPPNLTKLNFFVPKFIEPGLLTFQCPQLTDLAEIVSMPDMIVKHLSAQLRKISFGYLGQNSPNLVLECPLPPELTTFEAQNSDLGVIQGFNYFTDHSSLTHLNVEKISCSAFAPYLPLSLRRISALELNFGFVKALTGRNIEVFATTLIIEATNADFFAVAEQDPIYTTCPALTELSVPGIEAYINRRMPTMKLRVEEMKLEPAFWIRFSAQKTALEACTVLDCRRMPVDRRIHIDDNGRPQHMFSSTDKLPSTLKEFRPILTSVCSSLNASMLPHGLETLHTVDYRRWSVPASLSASTSLLHCEKESAQKLSKDDPGYADRLVTLYALESESIVDIDVAKAVTHPKSALPDTIRNLEIEAPVLVRDATGILRIGYPLLEQVPKLEKLRLFQVFSDDYDDLPLSPLTKQLFDEHLRCLKSLDLSGFMLPLRSIFHRLHTLEYLFASTITVHEALFPAMEEFQDQQPRSVNTMILWRHLVKRVLPPKLRVKPGFVFACEWNEPFFKKLPKNTTRMEICLGQGKESSLAWYLPLKWCSLLPASVTDLDLRSCYLNFNPTNLPKTLQRLAILMVPTKTGTDQNEVEKWFAQLPRGLLSLNTSLTYGIVPTVALVENIPRTVRYLSLNQPGGYSRIADEVWLKFPPALVSLHLNAFINLSAATFIKLLPQTLVSLSLDERVTLQIPPNTGVDTARHLAAIIPAILPNLQVCRVLKSVIHFPGSISQ